MLVILRRMNVLAVKSIETTIGLGLVVGSHNMRFPQTVGIYLINKLRNDPIISF